MKRNNENNSSYNRLENGINDGIKENFITDNYGKHKSKQITLFIFIAFLILTVSVLLFK